MIPFCAWLHLSQQGRSSTNQEPPYETHSSDHVHRDVMWVGLSMSAPFAALSGTPFYLGADISTLSQVEDRGGVYLDDGTPADTIALFMKHGWTCFRLRIWVDPRNGVNGLEHRQTRQADQGLRRQFHARLPLFRLVGGSAIAEQTCRVG